MELGVRGCKNTILHLPSNENKNRLLRILLVTFVVTSPGPFPGCYSKKWKQSRIPPSPNT